MKHAILSGATAALALLLGPSMIPAGPAAVALGAPATAPAVDSTQEFLEKMRRAMEIGAHDEIAKMVRIQTNEAVWATIQLCDANANNPSERLEEEINTLRLAWKASMKTGFVEKVYEYYSLMDLTTRKDRFKEVNRYKLALNKLVEAEAAGDMDAILSLQADFVDVARAIEALGDHYYAGEAWLCYARTQDEVLRGDDANLDKAAEAYKKVVEHRDAIELNDLYAQQSRERYEGLTGAGYGPDAESGEEGEGGAGGGPMKAAGDALTSDFTFRIVDAPDEVVRPNWSCDVAYNSWNSWYLEAEGSSSTVSTLKAASLERTGIQSFDFVSGGERTSATMNGKFVPVEVTTKTDAGQLPWGFIAITGTKKDYYQGVEVNREASRTGVTVFVAPAARIEGMVGEAKVEVYDDNMTGVYGDEPTSWAYVGMTKDHFQWDLDAIRVDGDKKARPWSRLQEIDGTWYDLAVTGHQVQATPITPKTGELKLKFKGPKPDYVILRGTDKLHECYFDISGGKAVEVPIGRYELFTGFIFEGKRDAVKKVVILPGENTPKWKVEAGETTEVKLGGPFGFDFAWEDNGETVTVLGSTVCVEGVAGERYERPWNARAYPMVSVKKAGAKRGSKHEKMQSNVDVDTLYANWGLGWYPQDLELPKGKAEGSSFELQLIEKKNRLFGKLESKWKGPGSGAE